MKEKTRKLTLMAMLAAMSYLVMLVGRIPVVMFLKYDPKDAVIAIGGFLLGPWHGALISVLVSLIEMLTASDTGFIGFFMNVLSTCAFVVPAAWFYRRRHSLKGAVAGLAVGVVLMTAMMLAWNVIVTPIYMGYPRQAVVELLMPVFLPFNLVKGVLNAGLTMLVYKPVSRALKKAGLIPSAAPAAPTKAGRRMSLQVTLISLFVIATAVVSFWLLHRA